MSNIYGADVADLKVLAASFDRAAQQLRDTKRQVGNGIQISAWVGPFAARFRVEWDSANSVRVESAAQLLTHNAAALRRNAEEQERASSASGGGMVFSGGLGDFSRDPLVDFSRAMLPTLESSLDLLRKSDDYLGLLDALRGSPIAHKIPILSGVLAGYDLIKGFPQTWDDIQSGNIFRFGDAVLRTGWTVAQVVPPVGLVASAASLGIDTGKMLMDGFLGQGASDRAFAEVGRQISDTENGINHALAQGGAAVVSGIRSFFHF